ncbi:MAG: WecB/TagA/CpsF family glycosyltransferase [Ignavibacteriae bacterium]|nr:WecB/TagA/CpsF family glycosyltransferase [Ignavibacteriota bacterium]
MNATINILGLEISNSSYDEIINILSEKIRTNERFTFHNVNASILLKYLNNTEFRKSLNSFDCLYSDGIGMYSASRFLYGKKGLKQRVNGTDLYYRILENADNKKLKCFFYGGSAQAVGLLPGILKKNYPGITVTGIIPRSDKTYDDTLKQIMDSSSDILFAGLGTPVQENFIAQYSGSLNVPVQIAVGSGLEFISGAKKRAPEIFLKLGIEWIYRIYLEPLRLWKRYFFGIPAFIFKIIIFKFKLPTIKENS